MELDLYFIYRFLVAIGLGILIGAERWRNRDEHEESEKTPGFAGVRTYSFFSVIGFAGAILQEYVFEFSLLSLILVLGGIVILSYHHKVMLDKKITTASVLAMIASFLIGTISYYNPGVAVIIATAILVLLTTKKAFRHFVDTLSEVEFLAALKFIIISFVVLPLLPSEAIDPWGLLIPYEAWLMVVAVSAVSFAGYILTKLFGVEKGVGLAGAVGGLASSTATTISLSEQSRVRSDVFRPFVLGMVISSTIMFFRVGLWVFFVNSALIKDMLVPLLVMIIMSFVLLGLLYIPRRKKKETNFKNKEIAMKSPFRLWPALQFGGFYIVLTIIAHFLYQYFGKEGLYVASFFGGLTDVDAITLSLTRLSASGELSSFAAITGISVALASNTIVKAGIALTIANRKVGRTTAAFLIFAVLSGLVVSFIM